MGAVLALVRISVESFLKVFFCFVSFLGIVFFYPLLLGFLSVSDLGCIYELKTRLTETDSWLRFWVLLFRTDSLQSFSLDRRRTQFGARINGVD